jgi:LPPG:FO 2-phospho-L-lactate transferase
MRIVCLAGGVGGARLAFGLMRTLPQDELTVVVNTGDDFAHLGLRICPDLDTVMYTLAGLANRQEGWGLANDTFAAMEALDKLAGETWFRLGDRDIATHLRRTQLLKRGLRLTEVTQSLCAALDVKTTVLPMTDQPVATRVVTDEGTLDFQDYFVRRRCEPSVSAVLFAGIDRAEPSPEVRNALAEAHGVILAPSNPFVSIDPILSLPGIRDLIALKPAVAVSPIVGGQAVKGPAAKMLAELGLDVSASAVAGRYADVVRGFVMDEVDSALIGQVQALGMQAVTTQSIMRSDADREAMARVCLRLVERVPAARQP